MTLNPDYRQWNVESHINADNNDNDSVLTYWRKAMRLRKEEKEVLICGDFEMLPAQETGEQILGYERKSNDRRKKMVVLLSFAKEAVSLSGPKYRSWKVVLSNMPDQAVGDREIMSRPYEALVLSQGDGDGDGDGEGVSKL